MEDNNKDSQLETREHHINQLNKEAKTNIVSRIVIAIILVAIFIPCIILGGYFWLALIFFLILIMTHELCKAPQSIERKFKGIIYLFAYFMMFALVFYIFLKDLIIQYQSFVDSGAEGSFSYDILRGFKAPQISLTCFCISIAFFFINVFIDDTFTIHDAFYLITMLFVVSLGLQCLIYLRFLPFLNVSTAVEADPMFKYFTSSLLILYFLLGTCFNDVGAFFIGVLFGKHKFCPKISPKKTIEGFVGGVIISFIISFGFGMLLSYFGYPLLEGVLDLEHWYNILIISIIMPLSATLGDLLFSSIKRAFKIKDFGTILKSHGGILDRFDSIIVTSITTSLLILIMIGGVSIFA